MQGKAEGKNSSSKRCPGKGQPQQIGGAGGLTLTVEAAAAAEPEQ
jgi:hypothetical protein